MTNAAAPRQALARWDIYCRVIDNFGDIGVCWRLCQDLAARGHSVRLVTDDASALAWMRTPEAYPVDVWIWTASEADVLPGPAADVVVEAFGCDPPTAQVAAWRQAAKPPVWINLEYLSAEPYVERSHGLPSPQFSGPGQDLTKWFFYPGFTEGTGGLLREPEVLRRQQRFDAPAWWAEMGLPWQPGLRSVSLFCYPQAPLPALLAALPAWSEHAPVRLLSTASVDATRLEDAARALGLTQRIQVVGLPWLSHADYDHLLWACDLNLVRGEDSLVRAQWAGRPFLWQLYAQDDGAHGPKLDAFMRQHLAGAENAAWPPLLRQALQHWNGLTPSDSALTLPPAADWQAHALAWRQHLSQQTDLCTQLVAFAQQKADQGAGGRPSA